MTLYSQARTRITSLKADVDALLRKLSEGEYVNVDMFANNWVHLTALYAGIQVQMYDRVLMAAGPHGPAADRRPDGGGPDDYGDKQFSALHSRRALNPPVHVDINLI